MNAPRTFAVAGLCGALLTILILAMSVLMRLGTRIDGGEAVSVLVPGMELAVRAAHRVAAMAVGVLAAWALVTGWRTRPLPRAMFRALAAIASFTLLLAAIGRYTPGYRFDLVTVANVVGGIGLAVAFWWLRAGADGAAGGDALAAVALVPLLVLGALGAGVDAAAMRGERAFGPLHLWLATVFSALVLAAAWRQRSRPAAKVVATLCAAQFALGFFLLGARPMELTCAHALLACGLALGLVQLAARR